MLKSIALVNICFPKEIDVIAPPQGLLSIASVLHEHGIQSKLYDTALDINYQDFILENIIDYLISIPEAVIGISVWDSVFPKIVLATKELKKKHPEKIIILGGPTISSLKQKVIEQFHWVDYCIIGEGEYPLLELMNFISQGIIPDFTKLSENIIGNNNRTIIKGKRLFNGNLHEIPIINYKLIDHLQYNRFEVSTSRGCPFKCEFCSVNSTLDNKIRFRNLASIFDEIDSIFTNNYFNCVNIVDDNFGLNKERLYEFCNNFKIKYPKKTWTCYFRLDDLTIEIIDLMVDSGCIGVFIGIEAGNSKKLKSLGKFVAYKDIVKKLGYATSKMDITASFIWGFPDENEEQLLDTFSLINRIADFENIIVDLYQLAPLSGTQIQKNLSSCLTFDIDAISGFIYPSYLPFLNNEEIKLIKEIPDFFSAFYHEDTSLFGNKYYMVKKFFEEIN